MLPVPYCTTCVVDYSFPIRAIRIHEHFELAVCADLAKRCGDASDLRLLKPMVQALDSKGFTLGQPGPSDEALAVHDELVERFVNAYGSHVARERLVVAKEGRVDAQRLRARSLRSKTAVAFIAPAAADLAVKTPRRRLVSTSVHGRSGSPTNKVRWGGRVSYWLLASRTGSR